MATDNTALSPIRIFADIQAYIQNIDTSPLSSAALEVNADAYSQLGSDEPEGRVFARLDYSFTKSDNELAFVVDFVDDGVALGVGAQDMVFVHYAHFGKTSKQVAERLIAIVTGLANGQLAVLVTATEDDDRTQAVELLYRRRGAQGYQVLLTYPFFQSKRKLRGRELTTSLYANKADIEPVAIHIPSYKGLLVESDNKNFQYNRSILHDVSVPLDSETWEKSITKQYDKAASAIEKKIDNWFDIEVDPKLGFWQQLVADHKKGLSYRHLTLLWVSAFGASVIVNGYVPEGYLLAYITLTTIVLTALFWRRKKIFPRWQPLIAVLAVSTIVNFTRLVDPSLFGWVALVMISLELAETVTVDGIRTYEKYVKADKI